jgi:hypothetical protein
MMDGYFGYSPTEHTMRLSWQNARKQRLRAVIDGNGFDLAATDPVSIKITYYIRLFRYLFFLALKGVANGHMKKTAEGFFVNDEEEGALVLISYDRFNLGSDHRK